MNISKILVFDKTFYLCSENSLFSEHADDEDFYSIIDIDTFFDTYIVEQLNLCLNVSNACNLKCKYCFNHEKSGKLMDFETAKKMIDDFISSFPLCQKYFIDVSGKGEPLLNLKTIYQIKDFTNELSNKLNREILVSFVTNGVLLTPKLAEDIQNHGILFGISLDGNKFAHDAYRIDTKGDPTYDLIINNVKGIKFRDYIGCAVTLTDKVFSIRDSLIELSEIFKTISYKPVRDDINGLNENNIDEWISEYEELILFLEKTLNEGNTKYIKILLNGDDYFGKLFKRCLTGERTVNRCDAGISRFALNDDGKVYACPPMSTSDFEEASVDPVFNAQRQYFSNSLHCEGCPYFYICGGECEVNKILGNDKDRIMCKYKQALIKLGMYLTLKIQKMSSGVYSELLDFCQEKNNRSSIDKDLEKFLNEHSEYNFVEGKKVYDSLVKKY